MPEIRIDGSSGENVIHYQIVVAGPAQDLQSGARDQHVESLGPFSVISGLTVWGTDRYQVEGPIIGGSIGHGDAVFYYNGNRFTSIPELKSLSGGDSVSAEAVMRQAVCPGEDSGTENGGSSGSEKVLFGLGAAYALSRWL
jgi:hypothetical protein